MTDEQITGIIDAGLRAPDPINLQSWKFIVFSDPEIKKQIKEVAESAKQELMDSEGPGWQAKAPPRKEPAIYAKQYGKSGN